MTMARDTYRKTPLRLRNVPATPAMRKQYRIPLSPANYASMHPRKENMLTSITKNKLQSPTRPSPFTFRTEERAARRKQARVHIWFFDLGLLLKLQEKAKTELRRLRQSFCFKARPLPSFHNEREIPKSPLKKVTNAINKKPMATPSKGANGVNKTSETPSVKRSSKSLSAYKNKLQSPTIPSPFTFRTEERATKRKEKFEEKYNETAAANNIEARPLPSFYNERETPKSPLKKNLQANLKSLTPARKPPISISQPSSVKKSSRRLWKIDPADHPLSKYAALIEQQTPKANLKSLTPARKPPISISQPSSVKKSSRRLWKIDPADHPLSKYAALIEHQKV
ncbi:hypothetical protein Tco_1093014 [Tanacetum coccineum]|uniref:TPX2 C-terminal domain-containing protein n=1 Tax=Tanacetum coccineum TaxID=301880 RepID=A0ABQ5ICS0_9ASTR